MDSAPKRPVCSIVGAGAGLGRALAAKFAEQGFNLALLSRTREGSAAAAHAATGAAPDAIVRQMQADATGPETIEQALEQAAREMGTVEVLIYNVRKEFTARAPLEMSYAELDDVFRIEVIGAFAAAKSVLPAMIDNGRGTILFSSATAAFRGSAEYPLYSIGKFGLRALSQSLAKAHARDGVHIAHMRLDCDLDVPVIQDAYGDSYDPQRLADPAGVAETYWLTHLQPKSAWSNEVEIRPHTETWTY